MSDLVEYSIFGGVIFFFGSLVVTGIISPKHFDSSNPNHLFLLHSVLGSIAVICILIGILKRLILCINRVSKPDKEVAFRDVKIHCVLVLLICYGSWAYIAYTGGNILVTFYFFIVAGAAVLAVNILFCDYVSLLTTDSSDFFGNCLFTIFYLIHTAFLCGIGYFNYGYREIDDKGMIFFSFLMSSILTIPNEMLLYMACVGRVKIDHEAIQRGLRQKVVESAGNECETCHLYYNDTDRTPRVFAACGHTVCQVCAKKLFKPDCALVCPFCQKVSFSQNAYRHTSHYRTECSKKSLVKEVTNRGLGLFIGILIITYIEYSTNYDSSHPDHQLLVYSVIGSISVAWAILALLKAFLVWKVDSNSRVTEKLRRDSAILFGSNTLISIISCAFVAYFGNNCLIAFYFLIVSSAIIFMVTVLFHRSVSMIALKPSDKTIMESWNLIIVLLGFSVSAIFLNVLFRTLFDAFLVLCFHLGCLLGTTLLNMQIFYIIYVDGVELNQEAIQKMNSDRIERSAGTECEICVRDYNFTDRIPRVLPNCGHTVCHECAEQLFNVFSLCCPFCQTVSSSYWDVYGLRENKTVLRRMWREKAISIVTAGNEICYLYYNDTDRSPRVFADCGHTVCQVCAKKLFKPDCALVRQFCQKVSFSQNAYRMPKNGTIMERLRKPIV